MKIGCNPFYEQNTRLNNKHTPRNEMKWGPTYVWKWELLPSNKRKLQGGSMHRRSDGSVARAYQIMGNLGSTPNLRGSVPTLVPVRHPTRKETVNK